MNREDNGELPHCPPGLEPFQNELRQSARLPDLRFFILRAADAEANEIIALQHKKTAGRTGRPKSFVAQVRNFARRHFLLAARGLAFLLLLRRKHFLPGLFRVSRARLAAFLRDLKADGINERWQRKKTLGGGQLPFGRWRALRAFDRFALDRVYLVACQQ